MIQKLSSKVSKYVPGPPGLGTLLVVGGIVFLVFTLRRIFASNGLIGQFFGTPEAEKQHEKSVQSVENLSIKEAVLTRSMAQIRQAADSSYQAFLDLFGTNEKLLFDSISGFSSEDLKAVAKEFGYREDKFFGFRVYSGNIFEWYQAELGGDDLVKMKSIWAKTELW